MTSNDLIEMLAIDALEIAKDWPSNITSVSMEVEIRVELMRLIDEIRTLREKGDSYRTNSWGHEK